MVRLAQKPRSAAAERLKRCARKLFAARGVDGVTVRDIAKAAGQKNHAAVAYYFGSKEELVRAMIIDGAKLIDEKRNAMLDALERSGGPNSVKDIVYILVQSSVDFGPEGQVDDYNRFVFLLGMTHREFFLETLENEWNSGYMRCVNHLGEMLGNISATKKSQKLIFFGLAFGAVMAARDTNNDKSDQSLIWTDESILSELVDSLSTMLK